MPNNYGCPQCGNPVVYDGGLYHCDKSGHGAWDRESLLIDGVEQVPPEGSDG